MPPLRTTLPWPTSSPLIVNAPMADNAGGLLAATVTLAGGLGLIGTGSDMSIARRQLLVAQETLAAGSLPAAPDSPTSLPIGIGFLPFICALDAALAIVREFRPAVVWLFAARETADYGAWARGVRAASPGSSVWVQTGSVAAALEIARSARPDALVLQGADAGGHGFEKGAGIVSLLPEAADALAAAGFGDVPLLASGGVVDGRGVAAAVALGAQGVVMGTRFLAAREALVHPVVRAAVLEARDGGQVTTRSKLFDQLRGPSIWPEVYDGRSLRVKSYTDFAGGVGLGDIQRRHSAALEEEDRGLKTGLQGTAAIWAGTGVGLVREVEGARAIVGRVRDDARKRLEEAAKF